jgi:hypothetical protein
LQVTSQIFLALTHLLGGQLGKNELSKGTGALTDIGSVACAGRVRINFVRSDLLLWTSGATAHMLCALSHALSPHCVFHAQCRSRTLTR